MTSLLLRTAGLSLLLLAAGCTTNRTVKETSPLEAFAAAELSLAETVAPYRRDPAAGELWLRYAPGELDHRAGLHTPISFDLGSTVRVRIRPADEDAVSLEVTCTEDRYFMPIPPTGGLRDPEWEEFLRGNILERLRWNRLRARGVDANWQQTVADLFTEQGLEIRFTGHGEDGGMTRLEAGENVVGLASRAGSSDSWLVLGGPPRVGGDRLLESLASRLESAGAEVTYMPPALELP